MIRYRIKNRRTIALLLTALILASLLLPQVVTAATKTWGPMVSDTEHQLFTVWGSSPTNVLAAGTDGIILQYNGIAWNPMTSDTTRQFFSVWGSSANNVFAVGEDGTILRYNGSAWNPMVSDTSNDLLSVWGSFSNNVFVTGTGGTILHYNGSTWSPMSTGTEHHFYGIWGSSATNVFAAGTGGTILHYNGSSWSPMTSNTPQSFFSVWGSSATDVFAVGTAGTILHYNGSAWSIMTSGISANLYGVWGSSATNVFAVGAEGIILHYNGSAWSEMTSNNTNSLRSVWGISSENVFAVGTEGTIINYAPLTITSVNPNQGHQGETIAVTITGTNFARVNTVYFGAGVTINSFTIDSSTRIAANISIDNNAILGYRDVSVSIPEDTATLVNGFRVTGTSPPSRPTIIRVNPGSGEQGQRLNSVAVIGTNLIDTNLVSFGAGITVNSFTVNNSNLITADISIDANAVLGPRDVSVTVPGDSATLAGGFVVTGPAPPTIPTITQVNPGSGEQGERLNSVDIIGTNLSGANSVSFGAGINVNSFTVDSSVLITADISIDANATVGLRDVSVTVAGHTATLADGFRVTEPPSPLTPTIIQVIPSSGEQGERLNSVSIIGTNLSGANSVSFGTGIPVNSFTVNNSNLITADISIDDNATVGLRDVSVTVAGHTATLADGFRVTAPPSPLLPTIIRVVPGSGKQGERLNPVNIIGTNLSGVNSVSFGDGITVNSFTVDNPTLIKADISIDDNAAVGPRDVSASNSYGTGLLINGFRVTETRAGTIIPFWLWLIIALLILLLLLLLYLLLMRLLPFRTRETVQPTVAPPVIAAPPIVREETPPVAAPVRRKRYVIPLILPVSVLVWEFVRHMRSNVRIQRRREKEPPDTEKEP